MSMVYGMNAGDVMFSASDVGWVVGHSFVVYGPLLKGSTSVIFEGKGAIRFVYLCVCVSLT